MGRGLDIGLGAEIRQLPADHEDRRVVGAVAGGLAPWVSRVRIRLVSTATAPGLPDDVQAAARTLLAHYGPAL